MTIPLAYFLTWTCYGTRLHGDARGSIERDREHGGTRFVPRSEMFENADRALMRDRPFTLDRPGRDLVDRVIRDVAEFKGWRIVAINVRSTHVHVVVRGRERPERIMGAFKARATRMLREAGMAEPERSVWTAHGSTIYLWSDRAVGEKADYVLNFQDGPRPAGSKADASACEGLAAGGSVRRWDEGVGARASVRFGSPRMNGPPH